MSRPALSSVVARTVGGFLMCVNVLSNAADRLDDTARAEVDGLLARLGASDCSFYRNGSWHDAAEAEAHLKRKLDYLVARDAVSSAEAFIDRAATRSSLSGKPYKVRCGRAQPVASAVWLQGELRRLRSGAATPAR